jgi:DNA-binding transcriptional MerR regulator
MKDLVTLEQLTVLVELALEAVAYHGPDSARVRAVPDLRTIRYYTTLGLLAPPAEMRGRKAFYGRRHLLQLVAIKRLQAEGKPLVEVQRSLAGADDCSLARWAGLPAGFWDRATESLPASASPSLRLAGSGSVPKRDGFWGQAPAVPASGSPAGPQSPQPQMAVHLPVADGAKLVLEGIDPQRLDAETLARLSSLLTQLSRGLCELRLIRVSHTDLD